MRVMLAWMSPMTSIAQQFRLNMLLIILKVKMTSFAEEDKVNNLAFAAVALTVQDSITM
jgi:hypothetical protein